MYICYLLVCQAGERVVMNTERQPYILFTRLLEGNILYDAYVQYTALFSGGMKPSCSPNSCLQFCLPLMNPIKLRLAISLATTVVNFSEVLQSDQANL